MNDKIRLIILGAGGFAQEVADLVGDGGEYELAAFAESEDRERCQQPLLGRPVLWIDDLPQWAAGHEAVCAIGSTHRSAFIQRVAQMGFRFATVVHPTARVSRTSTVGPGCVLSAGVVVATQTTVGAHVILNRGALVGHHTRIGDYVTLSPGANVAGSVSVGEGTYIGMGAVILDGLQIGRGSVVGAGAVVTRDVPDHVQVLGVPARVTRENIEGR